MIHLGALPGAPSSTKPLGALAAAAAQEATRLVDAGFDGVIIENMHDRPYLRREVGPEVVAAMTRCGEAVRGAIGTRAAVGVQTLAGANRAALAIAHAIDATFIRAEGFVFASVADEGILDEADAGPLLRYRRTIGANAIAVWADIKKKHSSHAITADLDLGETARAAEFAGADAVIVTGTSTGAPTDPGDLEAVRAATSLPVVVGSGATAETISALIDLADSVIVGSALKKGGRWDGALDGRRVSRFMRAAGRGS